VSRPAVCRGCQSSPPVVALTLCCDDAAHQIVVSTCGDCYLSILLDVQSQQMGCAHCGVQMQRNLPVIHPMRLVDERRLYV
jgi:hypothetical protein